MYSLQKAYAKINLSLDVVGRLSDGYHELVSVMQTVSLCDTLRFEKKCGNGMSFSANCDLPANENNLIFRAAQAYFARAGTRFGLHCELDKRIPMKAGLGGGSADAAATLRALNALDGNRFDTDTLCEIGATVGADVPFCVVGGTRLCRGIGEKMKEIPNALHPFVVVVMGEEGISTPAAFAAIDEKCGDFKGAPEVAEEKHKAIIDCLKNGKTDTVMGVIYNLFEEVTLPIRPRVAQIKRALLDGGAFAAQMSGSGPSVFGLFESEADARAVAQLLEKRDMQTFVCEFE